MKEVLGETNGFGTQHITDARKATHHVLNLRVSFVSQELSQLIRILPRRKMMLHLETAVGNRRGESDRTSSEDTDIDHITYSEIGWKCERAGQPPTTPNRHIGLHIRSD